MVLPVECDVRSFFSGKPRLTEHGVLQPWILLPLLIGLVLGSAIGLYFSVPDWLTSLFMLDKADGSFLRALWQGSRFVLAALLLGTTFLGFALLPGLSALHGFFLGFGIAAAFRTGGFSGLPAALFTLGVPALLIMPAFLLAASLGARCSLCLLRCFGRGARGMSEGQGEFLRHIALIALLCLLQSLYSAFLLPKLLNAL